ncbi:hypothetical protein BDN70DRAFT_901130, partial [Pholiota conissans]
MAHFTSLSAFKPSAFAFAHCRLTPSFVVSNLHTVSSSLYPTPNSKPSLPSNNKSIKAPKLYTIALLNAQVRMRSAPMEIVKEAQDAIQSSGKKFPSGGKLLVTADYHTTNSVNHLTGQVFRANGSFYGGIHFGRNVKAMIRPYKQNLKRGIQKVADRWRDVNFYAEKNAKYGSLQTGLQIQNGRSRDVSPDPQWERWSYVSDPCPQSQLLPGLPPRTGVIISTITGGQASGVTGALCRSSTASIFGVKVSGTNGERGNERARLHYRREWRERVNREEPCQGHSVRRGKQRGKEVWARARVAWVHSAKMDGTHGWIECDRPIGSEGWVLGSGMGWVRKARQRRVFWRDVIFARGTKGVVGRLRLFRIQNYVCIRDVAAHEETSRIPSSFIRSLYRRYVHITFRHITYPDESHQAVCKGATCLQTAETSLSREETSRTSTTRSRRNLAQGLSKVIYKPMPGRRGWFFDGWVSGLMLSPAKGAGSSGG